MKIICFGDSNTYGYDPRSYWGDRYDAEDRWVDRLAEALGCSVVNAGENGREIPGNQRELLAFEQFLRLEMPADWLLIMLGTNDLLQGNSVPAVLERMDTFLRKIRSGLFRILLIAPPVLKPGEWVASRELIEASEMLNDGYKKLAEGLDIHFVNAGEWNLPLAFDGVHLTQEAHRALADGLIHYFHKGE